MSARPLFVFLNSDDGFKSKSKFRFCRVETVLETLKDHVYPYNRKSSNGIDDNEYCRLYTKYSMGVLDGLMFLHDQGMAHGNMSVHNVMVGFRLIINNTSTFAL